MSATASSGPVGISAEQLKEIFDTGESFTLIDTRDSESFDGWRLAGAEQYFYKPDHEFDAAQFRSETGLEREDSIVTICAKGKSSTFLAEALADTGFENVRYVEGGMEAWSAVYDTVEVQTPGPASVVQIQRRAKGCIGYLVADPGTGDTAAIDPTRHTDEFLKAADERGWSIERVLDTHIHADHISGGRKLASQLGVPYHLGERVTERDLGFEFDALERNEVVRVGEVDIKALFTPGHTSGMVSYLVGSEALLTGDTVFVDSVGRTELQFGDAEATTGAELLYDSLHGTLLAEPDSVTVLPGHFHVSDHGEYGVDPGTPVATTVTQLRTSVPLLSRDRESFLDYILESVPEKPPNYEHIIGINRGQRATEDEQEAIELELGPNRCAAE